MHRGALGILDNRILWTAVMSWAIAQLLKGFFVIVIERKVDFSRIVGPGGMPSSHSAFVTSLATAVGLTEGFDSALFALAAVFSLIIMYDAAGVRQAAGRQARILNQIVKEIFKDRHVERTKLRELLGHTPIEVFAGGLLGVAIAVYFMRPGV